MSRASSITVDDELYDGVQKYLAKLFMKNYYEDVLEALLMDKNEFDRAVIKHDLFMTREKYQEWCFENTKIVLKILNSMDNIRKNLMRGDLVETISEENRYRNQGTFIYDGEKIIELDYEEYTDYGAPPKFLVDEFGNNYWDGVLSYNIFEYE